MQPTQYDAILGGQYPLAGRAVLGGFPGALSRLQSGIPEAQQEALNYLATNRLYLEREVVLDEVVKILTETKAKLLDENTPYKEVLKKALALNESVEKIYTGICISRNSNHHSGNIKDSILFSWDDDYPYKYKILSLLNIRCNLFIQFFQNPKWLLLKTLNIPTLKNLRLDIELGQYHEIIVGVLGYPTTSDSQGLYQDVMMVLIHLLKPLEKAIKEKTSIPTLWQASPPTPIWKQGDIQTFKLQSLYGTTWYITDNHTRIYRLTTYLPKPPE